MSKTLALKLVESEPRILDLTLAKRLEFERPRKIRELIHRHETELSVFGTCPTVGRVTVTGRPYEEFYLNQKQAIFICMKAETAKAVEVQVEIVHAFDSFLRKQPKTGEWKYVRHTAAVSFGIMSGMLARTRTLQGKDTEFYHYVNEARLVNWVVSGEFSGLDRESLTLEQLNLLAKLEIENTMLLASGVPYAERKVALKALAPQGLLS